jgi:hypothetical protein
MRLLIRTLTCKRLFVYPSNQIDIQKMPKKKRETLSSTHKTHSSISKPTGRRISMTRLILRTSLTHQNTNRYNVKHLHP